MTTAKTYQIHGQCMWVGPCLRAWVGACVHAFVHVCIHACMHSMVMAMDNQCLYGRVWTTKISITNFFLLVAVFCVHAVEKKLSNIKVMVDYTSPKRFNSCIMLFVFFASSSSIYCIFLSQCSNCCASWKPILTTTDGDQCLTQVCPVVVSFFPVHMLCACLHATQGKVHRWRCELWSFSSARIDSTAVIYTFWIVTPPRWPL